MRISDWSSDVCSSDLIAVLGIKTEAQTSQPAFYVPQYMQQAGYTIVPVPVYYPEVRTILDQAVYRRLAEIPTHVDMVNVFRRPQDLSAHIDDILAAKPEVVWFQQIGRASCRERVCQYV